MASSVVAASITRQPQSPKVLNNGHADQHIAVEDEYGLDSRRLAVVVGTVHAGCCRSRQLIGRGDKVNGEG